MKKKLLALAGLVSFGAAAVTPVTEVNYKVAETDLAYSNITKLVGSNSWFHFPTKEFDVENQTVVRMNMDTIYSAIILDTSKNPTLVMPDTDGRYMSAMVVSNDHYIDQFFSEPGEYKIESETQFVMIALRTQINPNDPDDGARVAKHQQAVKVLNVGDTDHVKPDYDMEQLVYLRDKYAAIAAERPNWNGFQGHRDTTDEYLHMLGTAAGWGLLPDHAAQYINTDYIPNDKCYTARFELPSMGAGGFFSLTVYDGDGWIRSTGSVLNDYNVEYNEDGSFTARFGTVAQCGDVANRVDTEDNWNMTMRVYNPLETYVMPVIE